MLSLPFHDKHCLNTLCWEDSESVCTMSAMVWLHHYIKSRHANIKGADLYDVNILAIHLHHK